MQAWPLGSDNKPLPTALQAAKYNYTRAMYFCRRIHDDINTSREARGEHKREFIFPVFNKMYPKFGDVS